MIVDSQPSSSVPKTSSKQDSENFKPIAISFKNPKRESIVKRSFKTEELDRVFDQKKRLTGYYSMRFPEEENKNKDKDIDDGSIELIDAKPVTGKKHRTAKVAPESIESSTPGNIEALESIFVVDQKCILRTNDPSRIKWDLLVMLMATWNCYSIPFEIAFEPEVAKSIPWIVLDTIIDFFFFIDIILTFRTTYIDSSGGDEVTEPKQIAILYLKGRFWIDLLSTIPFDMFFSTDGGLAALKLFGLLKVFRVTRLNKIINIINVKDDLKMTFKLLKLVYFLVLYIHFSA